LSYNKPVHKRFIKGDWCSHDFFTREEKREITRDGPRNSKNNMLGFAGEDQYRGVMKLTWVD